MPELGKYTTEVLSAYAVTLLLLLASLPLPGGAAPVSGAS